MAGAGCGAGLRRAAGSACLLWLLCGAAAASEFQVTADSLTASNQLNVSSVAYFQGQASAPGSPAANTQLASPGGIYFDGTYYKVWTGSSWVALTTGTYAGNNSYVFKAGDAMTGQLTLAGSTLTVTGNAFSVGGSTLVATNGNVGIGTASPLANLDIALLGSVDGVLRISGGSTGGSSRLRLNRFASNFGELGVGFLTADAEIAKIGVTPWTSDIRFVSGTGNLNNSQMILTSAGNLGIGTTAPATFLDVNGAAQFGLGAVKSTFSATTGGLTFASAFTPTVAQDAATKSYVDTKLLSGGGPWSQAGSVVDVTTPGNNVVVQSTLTVQGNAFSVGGSTLVATNGNVGIGATSPAEKLQVSGDMLFDLTGTGTTTIRAQRAVFSLANTADIAIRADSDADTSGDILFQKGTIGAPTEFMRITNAGNVGVGTTSPQAVVHAVRDQNPSIDGWDNAAGLVAGGKTDATFRMQMGYDTTGDYGWLRAVKAGTGGRNVVLQPDNIGNVGVGITAPNGKLHIVNPDTTSNFLGLFVNQLDPDQWSAEFDSPSSGSSYGVYARTGGTSNAIPSLRVDSGNGQVFSVMQSGNVGIGTTGPGQKLEVGAGNIKTTGVSGGQASVYINKPAVSDAQALTFQTGGVDQWNLGVRSNNSYLEFWPSPAGTNMLTVTTSGNVGIGTSAPTHKLHVDTNDSANYAARIRNTGSVVNQGYGLQIQAGQPGGTGMPLSVNDNSGATDGNLLVVKANGNVGIGTTNPGGALQVVGSATTAPLIISTGTAAGQEVARITSPGNLGLGTTAPIRKLHISAAVAVEQVLEQSDALADYRKWNFVSDGGNGTTASNFYIRQLNDAGTAGPIRLFVNGTSGNVGVGTTAPNNKLHVVGGGIQLDSALQSNPTGGAVTLSYDGAGYGRLQGWTGSTTFAPLGLNPSGGNVGIGTTTPGATLEVADTFRAVSGPGNAPSSGKGLEVFYNSGSDDGRIISYDRNISSYKPFQLWASQIALMQGNVGIGTTNPGAKLEVSGDIKASNFQNSWTSYTPTTSLGHTGCVGRYIVMGKIVYVQLFVPGQALTTGAASWSVSLPLTSAANLPTELPRDVFINASSTRQTGVVIINTSASSADVYTGPGLGPWSSAGTGSGLAQTLIAYPID